MYRRIYCGVAALALLCATGTASAQDFSTQRLSDSVRHISSDDFQGRYPGTIGEGRTLEWLQTQYQALGLEPGGRDGQWLQPVELKRYTPVEGAAKASWTDAQGQFHALEVGKDILLRAISNDGAADLQNLGVVFAGYGIVAPERGWDDYGSLDVTGKIVLVVAGEPDGDLFNGPYTTNYQSGAYKADEARRRGAVAVLTVSKSGAGDAAWTRSAQFNNRQRAQAPGAADLEATGSINADVAKALGLDLDVLMPQLGSGDFRAFDLEGLSLSLETAETIDVLKTNNFVARIPGTTHPEETVIYSAHWDHVGINERVAGHDKIHNGAWDNASGTVGLVEMARAFKAGEAPARTVVFLHVTAEEMGLLGAYAYTADPIYPLETTVANINIDMLPITGPTHDLPIFGKGQNSLEDSLQALADTQGRRVTDDYQPAQGFYYRSDHFPFARAGVPALMTWHGWDWVEGGREAGEAAWKAKFGADYHRPSDEWSEALDWRSAVQNLTLLYRLGLDLANSRQWPTWKPASEFGQVRERSADARQ